jgi:hypothetical protein
MSDYGDSCITKIGSLFAIKDPEDVIDYAFNWAPWLDGDTISSSDFLLPDGLTEDSASFDDTSTQIFVSGGSCGGTYRITNRVVTAGGRTKDQTIRIQVRDS